MNALRSRLWDVIEALGEGEALDLDEFVAHHVSLHLLCLPAHRTSKQIPVEVRSLEGIS